MTPYTRKKFLLVLIAFFASFLSVFFPSVEGSDAQKQKKKRLRRNQRRKRKRSNRKRRRPKKKQPAKRKKAGKKKRKKNPKKKKKRPQIRFRLVSIFEMTPAQWSRFIAAVQKLKENGGYDDLVMLHNRSMAIGHRHERIWPWHRGLIYMFYARLRAIDSGLTVFPYWPADHPMAQQIFNPNFHAFVGGNGDPNNEYRVMDGPMANWPVIDPRTLRYREAPGVKRNLDMAWLPSQGHVNGLLGIGAYRNFWWRMEENPHDFIHSFVIGGDMSAGTSPSDIVFWLLHGWLDVVYNFWQVRHGRTNYSGNPSERMRNIAGTPIASSLFNPRDKHYGYQWYTMGSQSLSAASRGIESFSVGTNPPHQSDLVVQYMKDGSIMVGDAHFGPEWFHPNDDGTVTFGPLMYGRYRWEDIGYAIAFAIDTGIIPPDGGSMHHH